MILEKWVLPIFKKAGFQPASICTAARTDIECACCQICNYHHGYESVNSEPPCPDMYVCDMCERTYHLKCMRELGCYNDEQRQDVNAAEAWACPACASLSNEDKINRAYKSKEELLE
eukprot:1154249-Pelagomonas_calceolata.AAC.1